MLWAHVPINNRLFVFVLIAYLWGFGAELIGVQTGLIFGDYHYGPVLGPKISGTPLMIGVNWILVSYSAGIAANYLAKNLPWWLKGILAAVLLVILDLLIEPVAIAYDFWSWEQGHPPVQNYIGWFLVALPLQLGFARYFGNQKNIVGLILFILQLVFFAILGLYGK